MAYKRRVSTPEIERGIINDFEELTQLELMKKYRVGSEIVQRTLREHFNTRRIGVKMSRSKIKYFENEDAIFESINLKYSYEQLSKSEKEIYHSL